MDDLLWSLVRRSPRTDEIRFNEVLVRMNMGRTKLLSLSSSSYIPCLSVAFPPILDDLFGRHVGRDFPYTINLYRTRSHVYVPVRASYLLAIYFDSLYTRVRLSLNNIANQPLIRSTHLTMCTIMTPHNIYIYIKEQ